MIVHKQPVTERWRAFAEYVAGLLGDDTLFGEAPPDPMGKDAEWPGTGRDVVMIEAPEQSWVQRLLGRAPAPELVARSGTTVLVAREPRYPFERLLLVLRDAPNDEPAIRWTLRLAAATGAAVTVLLVVPWQPMLYATGSRVQAELEVLLAPNTPIGKKTRQVAEALLAVGAPRLAVYQQRGSPDRQMWAEMAVGDYDLLVIGAERGGRLYRWYVGELVPGLLRWCRCPVLVAGRREERRRGEMADG